MEMCTVGDLVPSRRARRGANTVQETLALSLWPPKLRHTEVPRVRPATSTARPWLHDPVVWGVIGAGILALSLGLYRLGALSLWVDEAVSLNVSGRGWHRLRAYVSVEPNFIAYYAGLKIWSVFGRGEFMLRLPSAIAHVLTVFVVAALANRMAGRRAVVVAAVLAAVHASAVRWSQEARPYTIVVLLAALSALLLLRAWDRPTARRWAAWVLVATLASYAHTFGAVAVAAQAGTSLVVQKTPRRHLLASGAAVFALCVPLLGEMVASGSSRIEWIPSPTADDVASVLQFLAGGGGLVLALAYGVAASAGMIFLRGPSRSLLAGWFVLPILFALAVTLFQPLLQERYLLVCAPAIILAAAAGLSRLRPMPVLAAVLVGFVTLSLIDVSRWYSGARKEDWRAAAELVSSMDRSGDAVIVGYGLGAFRHYFPAEPQQADLHGFTRRSPRSPQWRPVSVRDVGRIWIAVRGDEQDADIKRVAGADGRALVRTWAFTKVVVHLYAKP